MSIASSDIARVRRFNRFYTRRIGVLEERLVASELGLTEVRVLYEIANGRRAASEIGETLGIDAGYLSRILAAFVKRGLVTRSRAPTDGRRAVLALTARGRKTFAELDARASKEVARLLEGSPADARRRLLASMDAIEGILSAPAERTVILRDPRPGDLGWVVERHGALYAEEQGWGARFEAIVARVVADYVDGGEHGQQAWIAEVDGARAGSIFLVRKTRSVALLRLLLVEPSTRGLGLGRRLVDECIRAARARGYRTLRLWTNDVLVAARRIYERAGFVLVEEERHTLFGPKLVGQTWELVLAS